MKHRLHTYISLRRRCYKYESHNSRDLQIENSSSSKPISMQLSRQRTIFLFLVQISLLRYLIVAVIRNYSTTFALFQIVSRCWKDFEKDISFVASICILGITKYRVEYAFCNFLIWCTQYCTHIRANIRAWNSLLRVVGYLHSGIGKNSGRTYAVSTRHKIACSLAKNLHNNIIDHL